MNFEYQDLLKLDSLYNILSFAERLNLHLHILGDHSKPISQKCERLIALIKQMAWEPPKMCYHPDKLLYYYHQSEPIPAEKYKHNNPVLTQRINDIIKPF